MMSAMSNRLIRIVFLAFLSQQIAFTTTKTNNVVDAAYFDFTNTHVIDSCRDYGLEYRDTLELLEEDCTALCGHELMKSYDYADLEEDPSFIIRNTVCQCFEYGPSPDAPKEKEFECWSKAEVWDKRKPIMKCKDDYGIVSVSTCQNYCKRIDPKAFAFLGREGSAKCDCGGFPICSDSAIVAQSTASTNTVSTVLALAMGCIVALSL